MSFGGRRARRRLCLYCCVLCAWSSSDLAAGQGREEQTERGRRASLFPPLSLSPAPPLNLLPLSPLHSGAARLLDAALGGPGSHVDPELGGTSTSTSTAAPPLAVVTFRDAARADAAAIRSRMAELAALHGRAALVSFSETRAAQDGVEVATADLTRLFRAAEARLASFNQAPGAAAASGPPPLSPADAKVRDALRRTLAGELQALSLQFRRQQKAYLEKLRAARGLPGGGGGGGNWASGKTSTAAAFALLDGDGDDDGDGLAGGLGAPPAAFTTTQTSRAGALAALAAERDREVASVTTSIAALAQVMKDLSSLVIEQGTVLDRIDYNLEAASVSVDAGVRQLVRAEKAQRAGRLVSCILLLAALVVLMLLIIVLRAVF